MCYFEVSYLSSGVKFQKKLLAILKSTKSKANSQISKISGHRGSRNPKETADRGAPIFR